MLSRREFVRNCALIAAGVIAADQLEILDRLAPRRLFALGAMPFNPNSYWEAVGDTGIVLARGTWVENQYTGTVHGCGVRLPKVHDRYVQLRVYRQQRLTSWAI